MRNLINNSINFKINENKKIISNLKHVSCLIDVLQLIIETFFDKIRVNFINNELKKKLSEK